MSGEKEGREYYTIPARDVVLNLSSNLDTGLSSDDVAARQKIHGKNFFADDKKVHWWQVLLRQFQSFILYVLIFAAGISAFVGDFVEFYVIAFIILFIIMLGFFMEFKATRDMEALRNLTPRKARVMRDGKEMTIEATELVPGDVLFIKHGDLVPADARVTSDWNLEVNESALTGESISIIKDDGQLSGSLPLAEQKNMVFAGTLVTRGRAVCIVTEIGKKTEVGKISDLLSRVEYQTSPLQKRLDKLGKQFAVIVFFICLLIFFMGLFQGSAWERMLLLAVAVGVAGIPESLPTVIAVTLSVGMKRMAKQNVIIKKLAAVETLGTCDVICTDKTGTLTQNRMVVEKIYLADEVQITGEGFIPKGIFLIDDHKIEPNNYFDIKKLLEIGVFCNNSHLVEKEGVWSIDGEPTEGALLVLARKAGLDKTDFHKRYNRMIEFPFDHDRKFMSVVHTVEGKRYAYAKGAPEVVLKRSRKFMNRGRIEELTDEKISEFYAQIEEYASQGLRVLGLAYKEMEKDLIEQDYVESDLVFVGLAVMRDPPAQQVYDAIEQCKQAGTKVVMITGDNKITAKAIGRELGILGPDDTILTGAELDEITTEVDEKEFLHIIDSVTVYARTTPKHKLKIIEGLQKKGHIVAMTGDGVNDAPALKKANIGVAMGKRGTDVAKETAEMVILDDNFSSIVHAIKEGRTIYSNIRKFLYYLLAGNFSEVMLILLASVFGLLEPLTALMILFINVVTSEIPALGLSFEKSSPSIMNRKPRDPKEVILNEYLYLRIGQVLPLFVFGTLSLFMWELLIEGGSEAKAQTVAFATIIMFELFHVFNAKGFNSSIVSKRFWNNPLLLIGNAVAFLLMVLAIYTPIGNQVLGTMPLELKEWLMILGISSLSLVFVELQKAIVRSELKEQAKLGIIHKKVS